MKKDIDQKRIEQNKSDIIKSLKEVESFLPEKYEDFKSNTEAIRASERIVMIIVEAIGNITLHINARHFSYTPDGIPDSISHLMEEGVFDKKLGENLVEMARFRNKLVHNYWDIDNKEMFYNLTEKLKKDSENFIKSIEKYISK